MNRVSSLQSKTPLGPIFQNIGTLLMQNGERFKNWPVFGQKENGFFRYWNWQTFLDDVLRFSTFLAQNSFATEDRVAFITQKCYLRMVTEMAVISMGLVSVPIFRGYHKKMKSELLKFAEAKLLIVDEVSAVDEIDGEASPAKVFSLREFHLLKGNRDKTSCLRSRMSEISPDQTAIILFTSGTSGFPKGVMLTHKNILCQQRANEILMHPEKGMRFLSYLPWDHVFGALFERFFALTNGGCLCLDDSGGKNIDLLLANFAEIRPHVFFSVPSVYEKLSKISESAEAINKLAHADLRFLFTAAAPLPLTVSRVFQKKGIPMIEGWGLTETSPSCTLTKPSLNRLPGNVGFPIPGVEIRLSLNNEILVRGHNVMKGYFKLVEATRKVIDNEGWLHTGDIGEIDSHGLWIIGRKDRIFKLSNGKKISPQILEERIKSSCHCVKHAYVFGRWMKSPHVLIFPDFTLIQPDNLEKHIDFFSSSLKKANALAETKYERIEKALVVKAEPTLEDGDLTPSMKIKFRIIEEKYKHYIDFLTSDEKSLPGALKIFD